MFDLTKQARPYAAALFEIAVEGNTLAEWSGVLTLLSEITQSPVVNKILQNPSIPNEQLSGIVIALCKDRADAKIRNFVHLLAQNGRLCALPIIADLFERLRAQKEHTVEVLLTSAVPLDEDYKASLKATLSKKLERDANLQCEVDESLLGGLLIRTGDTVIDGSVKGELHRLQEALMG